MRFSSFLLCCWYLFFISMLTFFFIADSYTCGVLDLPVLDSNLLGKVITYHPWMFFPVCIVCKLYFLCLLGGERLRLYLIIGDWGVSTLKVRRSSIEMFTGL